jgi:4-hydroxy-2-oxoheptanedioate aldolase
MPHINRAIELLEQGQPIYYTSAEDRTFEGGVKAAATWADYISYEMEHSPFDMPGLAEFMRGLAAAGPTRSGHRTPAVIISLPLEGDCEGSVRANAWMIKQALATGVHGILLCHAEAPEAVRAFIEAARYPFNTTGVGSGLGDGRRGSAGQAAAAAIWGIPVEEYLEKADVWPLNPKGELLLGIKIENKRALANAEKTTKTPGLAFAEWGPGDMGMSLGFPNNHDEPYPDEMEKARSRVLSACKASGLYFLNSVHPDTVCMRIDEGVMICAGRQAQAAAEMGRKYTNRQMPW